MKSRDLQKRGGKSYLVGYLGLETKESCFCICREGGVVVVKKLLPSQREKKREAIALMTTFLANPGGDEASQEKWAGSFPLCAPGQNDCAPRTTVTSDHLFSSPRKPLALHTR